jgi:anti-anti-sigma regulatory factor
VPFSIAVQPHIQIVKLEGSVTIRYAVDLASRLAEDLEDNKPVLVETEDLEDVDTCVLQLLCSLRKTVRELSFDNPSQPFVDAVERCGLRRELLGAREGS